MYTPYLFQFAQVHDEFRIPELLSISVLNGFQIEFPNEVDVTRPFMILGLESEDHARILARRCILVKSICEFYARGKTYGELHEGTRASSSKWARYREDTSFKMRVTAYNHTIPQARQKEVFEEFSYMDMRGKIDMVQPEITLVCYEEYVDKHGTTRDKREGDGSFREVFFGRLIEEGIARRLVKTFDVKKRQYYGNTSMEAEISLLMANQTLASPGKVIYDPFIGTGSMAYTAAHFGAWVFGSDIDGRQMRGKEKTPGIVRAAAQYGVASRIIDLCTFDVTQIHGDAAKCSTPSSLTLHMVYEPERNDSVEKKDLQVQPHGPPQLHLTNPVHDQPYIPPTKPYELSNLATDLILLARYLLKPNGRLVFFLPTVTDEYEEVDVQTMLCDGMEVIANSLQDFGSWGRRLITIRKNTSDKFAPPTFGPVRRQQELEREDGASEHVPAHKDFRMKYFKKFNKDEYDD